MFPDIEVGDSYIKWDRFVMMNTVSDILRTSIVCHRFTNVHKWCEGSRKILCGIEPVYIGKHKIKRTISEKDSFCKHLQTFQPSQLSENLWTQFFLAWVQFCLWFIVGTSERKLMINTGKTGLNTLTRNVNWVVECSWLYRGWNFN